MELIEAFKKTNKPQILVPNFSKILPPVAFPGNEIKQPAQQSML